MDRQSITGIRSGDGTMERGLMAREELPVGVGVN